MFANLLIMFLMPHELMFPRNWIKIGTNGTIEDAVGTIGDFYLGALNDFGLI